MKTAEIPIVKKPLFAWVWSERLGLQILLIVIILITIVARVIPLEMQKRVVNEAISMRKMDLLLLYCGIYLASVIVASGLKFLINYLQSYIGERALAEMRKALFHHIITLPLGFFRKTQPGMVVSSLVTEIAAAGEFVGMALAVPLTSILTLVAFAIYLVWLNPLLAVISLSIYPLALFLVPFLQRRVNRANKQRVDQTRDLSNRIAESISGMHEIQGSGAFRLENRKFGGIVDRLMKIRIGWQLNRFGVKVSNNFFTSLSPFFIFLAGGYLTMQGQLELGALVAFLSAQDKLYEPWKEMIDYYQLYNDTSVRYKRVMEYFDGSPDHLLEPTDREPLILENSLEIQNLSFVTDTGIALLDNVSFSLKPGEHLALVGFSGSGKSTLAQCIAQLYKYTGGHAYIGGKEVDQLTKVDVINNLSFIPQTPFTFTGTIEENMLYGVLARAGDGVFDPGEERPSLDDIISTLQQAGIFVDVLRFGLNTILTKGENDALVETIVRVRRNFQSDFGDILGDYVEFFDEREFLQHSSLAENIILGTPEDDSFADDRLAHNDFFVQFLKQADLYRPFLQLGENLARQTIRILGNLPPDEAFFNQSPLSADEIDTYKLVLSSLKNQNLHNVSVQNQERLLVLALRYVPGRHKMVALPKMLEDLIIEGRALFKDIATRDLPGTFSFFHNDAYIFSQSILNNIFFGRKKTSNPVAQERIDQSIIQLLIEEDLLETITAIGLSYQVGSKGSKLSGGQCQKLAIARVFLKKPTLLIMDEATSALDNKSQSRIQSLLETRWKGKVTLISVVHRLDIIKNYDKVAVMKAGKIGEMGAYDELMRRKGMLYELVGH